MKKIVRLLFIVTIYSDNYNNYRLAGYINRTWVVASTEL